MSNYLFNSSNTNKSNNENSSTDDATGCVPIEEVQNLLMKCAYELGMDFEPKELKKRPSNQETLEILEIKKHLKSVNITLPPKL